MDRQQIYEITVKHYLSPIGQYLDDDSVSEVMINGPFEVYIERGGKLFRTDAAFPSKEAYDSAINNILQYTGKSSLDDTSLIDARLPDGSRIHVAKEPCSRFGTSMAIRKFSKSMLNIDKLVKIGALTKNAREFLHVSVHAEQNVLVSGGTSSGKTSLLNCLSSFIPNGERIVVIEDSAELQLQQDHVLSMETRPPDRYGRGAVSIRDLFRSSLRLRPDRIVIGEVRGGEALDLIQSMTSGHGGSMGTLHANNPRDGMNRLETMAMMSEVDMPLHALRAQAASAINLIVQTNRLLGGKRMVTHISEIEELSADGQYQVRDIFCLRQVKRPDGTRTFQLRWTGKKSMLAGELKPEEEDLVTELTWPVFFSDPPKKTT